MTSTIGVAREHLAHYAYEVEPFTANELAAIERYEDATGVLHDCLAWAEYGLDRTREEAEQLDARDDDDPTTGHVVEVERANILASFDWLSEWYERLDSLKSALRNPHAGPAHSQAAERYLKSQCNDFFRMLNLVRREACRWEFGTAGPRPEVDAGAVTFGDIPGIELDGTAVGESR